jgi:hypothetical protein
MEPNSTNFQVLSSLNCETADDTLIKGSEKVSHDLNCWKRASRKHQLAIRPRATMKPETQRREVSPGTRREVIGLRKGGMKYPAIEEELGVKANTAVKIMQRRNNGHEGKSAPRTGRPKKLNKRDTMSQRTENNDVSH